VTTNREFDVSQIGQSFAAEGIGNSQNATLFYEKWTKTWAKGVMFTATLPSNWP
jgi:hypothetical protein